MRKAMCVLFILPAWVAFAGNATNQTAQVGRASNGQFVSSKTKRDQRRTLVDVNAASVGGAVKTGGGAPGTIQVSASGEVLSLGGYAFPPMAPDDVVFVDGWEVRFTELLVTFANTWLATDPDINPADQSQTGPRVAQADGPWAIDLHKGGPLPGYGGPDEQAERIVVLNNQNLVAGTPPFDPTVRYAFGYDVVPASVDATLINLAPGQLDDYQFMVENGRTVMYVGTATWCGTASTCSNTDPSFDFSTIPTEVRFRLGWRT